jgi:uracil-DNA glycosylase
MAAIPPRKTGRQRSGKRRVVPSQTRVEWTQLSNEIRTCQRCPLGQTRTRAVVYRGSLAPRVVFVGEAPGVLEDRTGIPFVGRSGRRLDAAIEHLGLGRSEFGVLNVLKCRPPGNRFDRSAARTCRPYLDRQLELLRPEVVVTLGASALRAFDPRAPPILTVAGRPRPSDVWRVFPLLHPAATLRSRRWAKRWESDLAALRAWLELRRE